MLWHLASQRGLRGGATDPASNPSGPPTTPLVRARNLRKSFGPVEVLRGVDLEGAGQVCCIIGPSGSGKSTLLRCGRCTCWTG